ncbi:MAG: hypothetical protein V5A84_05030, partial [Planctomycetota bacterium]
ELQRINRRIEEARTTGQKYRAQINKLKSPSRIRHLVRKHRLPLLNSPMERPVRPVENDESNGEDDDGSGGDDGSDGERAIALADDSDDDE